MSHTDDSRDRLPPNSLPSALDWARASGLGETVIRRAEERARRRRRRFVASVGGLCLLFTAGILWLSIPEPGIQSSPASSANVLAVKTQMLPDGSIVELKNGSRIAANFTASSTVRRVALLEGEAHFKVAKDAARPFVVTVGDVEVRAVGTAFSVQLGQTAVEVLVTEGRVAVQGWTKPIEAGVSGAPTEQVPPVQDAAASRSAGVVAGGQYNLNRNEPALTSLPSVLVDAGNRVVVHTNTEAESKQATTPLLPPAIEPVLSSQIAEALSWRVPRLEFIGTPLSEAIPMYNQHSAAWNGVRLILSDPSLGKLELSGVLRADHVEVLLEVLKREFGIRADRRDKNAIVLSKI